MKVIVFDLDDTLYDELTYVRSGFKEVASFLAKELSSTEEELFEWMWEYLHKYGRGSIFDNLLRKYNSFSKHLVRRSISVYRMHIPKITLPQETIDCLNTLKNYPKYIVTDGNKIVQHKKLEALGLYEEMKHCYITHRYGIHNAKPSTYCFLHIARREKVPPEKIVYIGDNPRKDFVGIKSMGFQTIRIMTGQHSKVKMSKQYEADYRISSIGELPNIIRELETK